MKKLVLFGTLALLLVASMGFVVVGDFFQEQEDEKDKAYLGIYLGEFTEKLAEKYELEMTEGAFISAVMPGSAAAKAGLQRHDIIVAIDGSPVTSAEALTETISGRSPGDVIEITVVRNGRRQTLSVELGERRTTRLAKRIAPEVYALANASPRVHVQGGKDGVFSILTRSRFHLGISYQELNEGLGEYFNRPDGSGILVTDVSEDSAAAEAGLKAGDVIIGIDGSKIADTGDLMNALRPKKDSDDEAETRTFQMEIMRRGQAMTISLEAKRHQGPGYLYRFDKDGLKHNMEHLRDRLKHFESIEINAPELYENFIMAMPEIEVLSEGIEMMVPDLDIMVPDLDMMLPDLEMMAPDFEFITPDLDFDFDFRMPDFQIAIPEWIEEFIDFDAFEGKSISISVKPDGSIIFNGKKFDSEEKLKEHYKNRKAAPASSLVT